MAKTKAKAKCAGCDSHDALFIVLGNGERLPSYAYDVASGNIYCPPCNDARKQPKCSECGRGFVNIINGVSMKVCHACMAGVES